MKKFIRKNLVIMLIIFFSAAIIVISGVLLWNAYKEYGDGFKYFEQGIVITLAVGGGCASLVSALIQNRKSIDADIKAKSRIEWIQRVREATAEFVTACYDSLNSKKISKNHSVIEEKGYLLKLYFGNDKKDDPPIDILYEDSNKGKNNKIYNKINHLMNCFEKGELDREYQKIFDDLIEFIAKCRGEEIWEVNDRLEYDSIPITDKIENSVQYRNFINKERVVNEKIKSDIKEFVDIIRLYLKIEWDRAKNNED
ncbi:MAG TPA: hypothetical protein P5191_16575 [Ruminococcus sp.]|nr:hypothetical protein [Ruminococcus sp.]